MSINLSSLGAIYIFDMTLIYLLKKIYSAYLPYYMVLTLIDSPNLMTWQKIHIIQ